MSDEKLEAVRNFERASINVRKGMTTNFGGSKYEKAYSDAYAKLVSFGVKPKIRSRYRY